MSEEQKNVVARTWAVIVDLIGDTVALAALIGSITAIGWLLQAMIKDPFLQELLTLTHDAGAWILFVIFLYHQIRKYLNWDNFNVVVVA